MRINTNIASLNAREAATNTQNKIASSLEKLSTGLKINKASDDASGLAIADKLRTQASSIGQGIDNGNSAVSLIQIADKSMSEQSNILDVVKAKLIQANTDTTSDAGREAIRKDINKLLEQLDNIAQQTNYNGTTLLQGGYDETQGSNQLSFQIGGNKDDIIQAESIQSNTLGLGGGTEELVQTSGASDRNNIVSQGTSIVVTGDGTNDITIDGFSSGTSLDVNLSGISGAITFSGSGTISNTDAVTQLVLEKLAAASGGKSVEVSDINGNVIGTFSISSGGSITKVQASSINGIAGAITFTVTSGTTINLGGNTIDTVNNSSTTTSGASPALLSTFSIGSMQITQSSASGSLTVSGNAQNLNITNLNSANGEEITVSTAASGGKITGGGTLSGLKSLAANQLTRAQADKFQGVVDAAISQLNTYRADLGSTQNQIESGVRNLMTQETNVKAAESIIRDVDYAEESSNFNKQNIISQAGSYAMSQANSIQQNVLRLLQ
ncbi:flagellin [uncultured Arcobacter sp.]|uniref:flagellin N-terminal helical domain-containing protein n=1 Tax=uncultured Arcobacter sp. TaxID=165434 RepID=UPI00261B12BD|nr:flagellin [uncultured Arcobacter sp.]